MQPAEKPVFPPLSDSEHELLWQHIEKQFDCNLNGWHTLFLNDLPLGMMENHWHNLLLQDWQGHIRTEGLQTFLNTDSWLAMADALEHMAFQWHKTGILNGWRNEKFDALDATGNALFSLERSVFRPLGLQSAAVHINGLVKYNGQWCFWIGKRSPYKAVDPNKLDNLVGGGISSGESVKNAMQREGAEEAGLPACFLKPLECQSKRLSLRPVSRGLHREVLYIFDIVLPEDFHPENQDGEVAEFNIFSISELTRAMYEGRLMNDALLATMDAYNRYGLINSSHPLGLWLKRTAL
ncbi:NUDIX hydrolase [Neisseria sp. S1]|uniref:NUDIX hydrolase n=1 Tax=Neisseria sp. S1 TaxID=3318354 RepID=UPI003A8785DA